MMKTDGFILISFGGIKKNMKKILAYCLMENHVHLLSVPEKETSLTRSIGETNLLYTQYINHKYNRSGRLRQNRFISSIVEEEPYLWAVIRYIEQKPVRTKVVKRVENYGWSSARVHILGRKGEFLSDESRLNEREVKSYREFLCEDDK